MNTWMVNTRSIIKSEEMKLVKATTSGRRRALVKLVAVLASLIMVILLTYGYSPSVGYAAFPGKNGKFVMTVQESDGNFEIYAMDADGQNRMNLTNNAAFDLQPTWSPDGQKITFVSSREGDQLDIFIMDADGSNLKNLTNTPEVYEFSVAWSPDGQKLAFTRGKNFDSSDDFEIFVMGVDGSNEMRLTNNSAEDSGPIWSPNGEEIAFTTNRDGNYEVYVMQADGNNQKNLTNNPSYDGFFWPGPTWSPDGEQITFASLRHDPDCPVYVNFDINYDCNWEVYVMTATGENQANLTNNSAYDSTPIWSADGKKIAFLSYRVDNNTEIFVMDVDGNNQTRLSNSPQNEHAFDWQSIGAKRLFYLPMILRT